MRIMFPRNWLPTNIGEGITKKSLTGPVLGELRDESGWKSSSLFPLIFRNKVRK